MKLSFAVKQVEYANRAGNLNVEASGVVKSKKHFPYYTSENGRVEIFKPLSKTKPLTTPCMLFYDYTNIFESSFIQGNVKIGEELAMHVLLSILKGDQNYHYENVAFICDEENNVLRLAPVIDHEFSTMFLFPEDWERNITFFKDLLSSIAGEEKIEDIKGKDEAERQLLIQSTTNLNRNIHYISSHYPNVTALFLEKLEKFEKDIDGIHIYDEGYVFPCNSFSFKIGQARYKNDDEEQAIELEKNMRYYDIDLTAFEKVLKSEIEKVIKSLRQELENVNK